MKPRFLGCWTPAKSFIFCCPLTAGAYATAGIVVISAFSSLVHGCGNVSTFMFLSSDDCVLCTSAIRLLGLASAAFKLLTAYSAWSAAWHFSSLALRRTLLLLQIWIVTVMIICFLTCVALAYCLGAEGATERIRNQPRPDVDEAITYLGALCGECLFTLVVLLGLRYSVWSFEYRMIWEARQRKAQTRPLDDVWSDDLETSLVRSHEY
eukprot:Blabericola_migrator_1__8382@NODE_4365_length_1198_cov_48_355438_g2530_i1_p1_GENE_NODE_4365_length_1198_cov_48_355438_g2530_i1NODE_4365_length_1198_cov_48_355438_g2530_i1_p1_ORF_typecomplete_len209_score14_51Lung_7TM_R/PF06814_13/0_0058SID1_RNA_chan/PF13965_6/0_69_NODE_4365_length_1198_cov_48_355438_g2530_i1231857